MTNLFSVTTNSTTGLPVVSTSQSYSAASPDGPKPGPPIALNRVIAGVVANIMSRAKFWAETETDRRRDIGEECGHPKLGEMDAQFFKDLHDSNSTAARVNELFPRECWQVTPEVYEDEDDENITQFEAAFAKLDRMLKGRSWNSPRKDNPQEGSAVWEALKRLDIMSGICHYGVMLLGFDDGKKLSEPVDFLEDDELNPLKTGTMPPDFSTGTSPGGSFFGSTPPFRNASAEQYPFPGPGTDPNAEKPPGGADPSKPKEPTQPPEWTPKRRLLFVRVLPETLAKISSYNVDTKSPRYGQPETYVLSLFDPQDYQTRFAEPNDITEVEVHWSRLIHVADNMESSPWYGVPRARPVMAEILDTAKVRGPSAEMYYKGAFPGISFETNPNLIPGEIQFDAEDTKSQIEDVFNGLQRWWSLQGMTARMLAPTVVDPNPQLTAQIQGICIKLGCPMRIFMGTERGELASSQDDAAWNDRLKERHKNHVSPNVIVPFIDRLILAGVLPVPEQYYVCWPDLTSQTAQEKSAVAFQVTQAITQYVSGNGADLIDPVSFLVRVIGPAIGVGEDAARTIYEKAEADANLRKQQEFEQQQSMMKLEAELNPKPMPTGPNPNGGGNGVSKKPPGAAGGMPRDGGGRGPSNVRR